LILANRIELNNPEKRLCAGEKEIKHQSPSLKVSVIIPTYNRAGYIMEAIESALNQTYKNTEIIVVDDGSTDDTQEGLSKFKDHIRYIYQGNRGPAFARNRGIRASQGEFIAFLDSDDVWLAEKLELQIGLLESRREVGLVYSDAFRSYGNTGIIQKDTEFVRLKPYAGWTFGHLFRDNFIHTSTVVVRRRCLEKVGVFDEGGNFVPAEDYELWLRIAARYQVDYINKPLIKYRDHSTNISGKNMQDELPQVLAVLEKVLDREPQLAEELGDLKKKRLSELHYWIGRNYFSSYELRRSRNHFLSVIQYSPYQIKPYIYLILSLLGVKTVKNLKICKRGLNKLSKMGVNTSLRSD
jgi:glycosyltransferase involved in cell wall biosynthesis